MDGEAASRKVTVREERGLRLPSDWDRAAVGTGHLLTVTLEAHEPTVIYDRVNAMFDQVRGLGLSFGFRISVWSMDRLLTTVQKVKLFDALTSGKGAIAQVIARPDDLVLALVQPVDHAGWVDAAGDYTRWPASYLLLSEHDHAAGGGPLQAMALSQYPPSRKLDEGHYVLPALTTMGLVGWPETDSCTYQAWKWLTSERYQPLLREVLAGGAHDSSVTG